MNRTVIIIILFLCVLLVKSTQAENFIYSDDVEESTVTISLTKFEVTDVNLELGWKIRNISDHNIWICDSLNAYGKSGFEVFLCDDSQTLSIRRLYNVRDQGRLERPITSRHICLQAGEEKTEFLSLDVPIRPLIWFGPEKTNAEFAKRLVLEIGYHNEDLPGTILSIVGIAEKFGYDTSIPIEISDEDNLFSYFEGLLITKIFNLNADFRESVIGGGPQIIIPYIQTTKGQRIFKSEKILRIEINSVSIPYKGNIPLTSCGGQRTGEWQGTLRSNNDKNKSDHEEGSDRSAVAKK